MPRFSRSALRAPGMILTALLAAGLAFAAGGHTASAHGVTTVGDYQLVIGFHNEPAYAGEPNGLDLLVTNAKTNEKVKGLEKTLQVEIINGDDKKALPIKTQFGKDGAYTADLIPTAVGDYTWHIVGSIQGTPCDVSMTSGPKTFGAVRAQADWAFPARQSGGSAAADDQMARTALIVGAAGAVLGLIGAAAGAMGLRAAGRKSA